MKHRLDEVLDFIGVSEPRTLASEPAYVNRIRVVC
jgi:hypothetical protein